MKQSVENMNQILATKVFPNALTVAVLALAFLAPEGAQPWYWISVAALLALNAMTFIWIVFRKAPNLGITQDAVLVRGLRIERRDMQSWRVFRSTRNGERARYIEIRLKSVPASSFGWRLAKLFEQVPTSKRCDREMPLAREPRIIAALNSWDLTKDEINKALGDSEESRASMTD